MLVGGLSISTGGEATVRAFIFGLAFLTLMVGAILAFSHAWGYLVMAAAAGFLCIASIILSIRDWDTTALTMIALPGVLLATLAYLISRSLERTGLTVEEF